MMASGDAAALASIRQRDDGDGVSPSRAAKRHRRDDEGNDDGGDRDGELAISIPPEVWAGVMEYLPFASILSCAATSRSMLHDTMPLLTTLHIDKSSEMNLVVASRFRDVKDIHINSLLTLTVEVDDWGEGPEEFRDFSIDFETTTRAVPFLSHLSRFGDLQRVSFGAKDQAGNLLHNEAMVGVHFWPGEETYPNFGSREQMLQFIDSISIGFRCGALPKHLKISGLCCPDVKERRGFGDCETCTRACKSFPVEEVLGFHCRGSSASNALSGRPHGLDVCLTRDQIETIVESRPGGPELLRSGERVLRLLGSARRYKIATSGEALYMVKYETAELNEIQRIIENTDAKKLHPQRVTNAIMSSFASNGSLPAKSLCYISVESLDSLRETGIGFDREELERPLADMANQALQMGLFLIGEADDDSNRGYAEIEIDCLRLVRRFIEEIGRNATLLEPTDSILAKYLDSQQDKFRAEAVSILRSILENGTDDDRTSIIEAGFIPSISRLLSSSKDCIVSSAITSLRIIVENNPKECIEDVAAAGSITRCIDLLSGRRGGCVVKDSLAVLAAAKGHIRGVDEPLLLRHLVLVIMSTEDTQMLTNSLALLRDRFDVGKPPVQAVINTGLVSSLVKILNTPTIPDSVHVDSARAMMDLTWGCNDEQTDVLLRREPGFLPLLVRLQDSPDDIIADRAISTLHIIANRGGTRICASWIKNESLSFGEYAVEELVDSDEEERDVSGEEAEEASDEQVKLEEEEAMMATRVRGEGTASVFDVSDDGANESPTLMGLPKKLLAKILRFTVAPGVVSLETVCKKFHRMLRSDDFWAPSTRKATLEKHALRSIRKFQRSTENVIRWVLGGEDDDETSNADDFADTFRTIAADLLSRMIHSGPEVHFRLRGDTIWYLAEFLEGHMIEKLKQSLLAAVNCHRSEVQKEDVLFVFRNDFHSGPSSYYAEETPSNRDLGMKQAGIVQPFDFSPYLPSDELKRNGVPDTSSETPSQSGIVWHWPDDDCCDVLPPEAGRRIIRRLAYRAGIKEMASDAFTFAEAELLRVMGFLIGLGFESSVEMAKTASYLADDDAINYRAPTKSTDPYTDDSASDLPPIKPILDMWAVPPPPLRVPRDDPVNAESEDETTYTIVPGQIVAAAELSGITSCNVYGNGWDYSCWDESAGFVNEWEIEESYYYKTFDDDGDNGESSDSEEEGGAEGFGNPRYAMDDCDLEEDDDDYSQATDDGIVREMVVEGCGVPEINGIYKIQGTCDNVPKFVKATRYYGRDEEFSLFRCKLTDNTSRWYISIVPLGSHPGTTKDIDFYAAVPQSQVNDTLPPRSNWMVIPNSGGQLPAPEVYPDSLGYL